MKELTGFYVCVAVIFVAVLFSSCASASGGTRWTYNYSALPVAPIVQPHYNQNYGQQPIQYYNAQPVTQQRIGGYTVIQQGGQQAVCMTQGSMTTCY